MKIEQLIAQHRDLIIERWSHQVISSWGKNYRDVNAIEVGYQTTRLLEAVRAIFAEDPLNWEPTPGHSAVMLLHTLSADRAKAGYTPTDTALYVITLKGILREIIEQQQGMNLIEFSSALSQIDRIVDRLAFVTFEAYTATREKIIAQQSLALLELSTPVVRLWERLLLLPLVGVIDTERARQITERLLEAITRYEATVAIMDVTGVPVMDTSVASHLMKAITAAGMLGARAVMTGISPEAAQTLVKLGISFQDVVTRATLRAGLAEGLQMLGKRVTNI